MAYKDSNDAYITNNIIHAVNETTLDLPCTQQTGLL